MARQSFRGKLEKETLTSWTASLRPDSPPAAPAPSPAPPRRPRVPSHIVPRRTSVSPRVVSTPASKLFARVEAPPTPEARDTPRDAPPPEPAPAALLDKAFGGDGDVPAAPPSSNWRELRTAEGRLYFFDAATGEGGERPAFSLSRRAETAICASAFILALVVGSLAFYTLTEQANQGSVFGRSFSVNQLFCILLLAWVVALGMLLHFIF